MNTETVTPVGTISPDGQFVYTGFEWVLRQPAVQHTRPEAKGLVVTSFVLSAVALFFIPILFGPLALIFGISGVVKEQPNAKVAVAVSIAATLLGMIMGAVVWAALSGY